MLITKREGVTKQGLYHLTPIEFITIESQSMLLLLHHHHFAFTVESMLTLNIAGDRVPNQCTYDVYCSALS